MTNHWNDIQFSDVILIMGSNAAENHPISFKYVEKARERGGKLISVDPRITRTTSLADLYAQIRPGSDIAFLSGIINYALQNDLVQKEYILEYTNASYLINPKFGFNDGLFSGYDKGKRSYSADSWKYQVDDKGIPRKDKSLQDPNCVYQLMKKHFQRYTPDKISDITGCSVDAFQKVAELFCSTHKPDRVATIMYAMGTTQHTVGVQNIRCYSILQLLMGNMGMAGGGINALRGEANVQGSTDHAILWHILPGYNPAPVIGKDVNLEAYIKNSTPVSNDPMSVNWWQHRPKYMISMLKAWFGENATRENDFCYDLLPKAHKPTPMPVLFEDMYEGAHKGAIMMGTNPVVGSPNANIVAAALARLDWLVCADIFETDTSIFWKAPGVNPENIKTEVFLLPMASSVEKEGSVSNSGRWAQWRYLAQKPTGNSISDLDLLDGLFTRIRKLYEEDVKAGKKTALPDPILKANWSFKHSPDDHECDPHLVAKEINGYEIGPDGKPGKQLDTFGKLKDDGSTASGNWIYAGSYTEKGNQMARRGPKDASNKLEMYPEWAWCWPVNRRIIYNRASVNTKGEPWNPKKAVIKWDGKKWVGDVPDGGGGPGEKHPFIMIPEGIGRLFSPSLKDGPLPEHYEPFETPAKHSFSSQQFNPTVPVSALSKKGQGSASSYPYVATSYRVVEHWQAGAMTRNTSWLNELVPDMFCEISPTLAETKKIRNGDRVKISSHRGDLEAYALVTERIQTMKVNGKNLEMVGMIWHFGSGCASSGDSCNLLTPHIGDPNTGIPEFKAFLVNIEKA
jgi:formate dehydrogenase major subunit